ncbi:pq loop repeat [Pseudozyma hubeiensis SY62]|uniref:Pq loop repeat n=1 Tax=Pseudozyma hubeiensis (strain SY62) TaxID=1305764 RepID=R9NZI6_PSEHS|nr:pq loop repeat [Pseudozyma hubeiensis SY62]GAC94194.1 pq loop repeat [Pseudozyma hubeiensis SY62]
MHQNYISKSAEGLSITFVVIWLAGDALNAAGAWFQGLLWTMIILALYYCACDCVLIFQYWFYRKYYHRGVKISTISASLEANERTPLIADGNVIEDDISSKDDDDDEPSVRTQIIMYTLAACLVVATGVAAWWVAEHHYGSDDDVTQPIPKPEPVGWRWDAQVAGWLSAVLYLSSRVPQILKNRTTKCEGLSLALFVFAVAGNLTYVASILLKSTQRDYIVESFSWLVGSLGTVFLDFIVLGQFIHYRKARKEIHRLRRSSIAHQERQSVQPQPAA